MSNKPCRRGTHLRRVLDTLRVLIKHTEHLSITQIHQELCQDVGLTVSERTTRRDVFLLDQEGFITKTVKVDSRYPGRPHYLFRFDAESFGHDEISSVVPYFEAS